MNMTGEDDILALVGRFFSAEHPSLLLDRGDDCAVLRPGAPLAVSTDIFAEDTHFRILKDIPFPNVRIIRLNDFAKDLGLDL